MKKLFILLFIAFLAVSCEKNNSENLPEIKPVPTSVENWEGASNFIAPSAEYNELVLKAAGGKGNGGGNGGGNNGNGGGNNGNGGGNGGGNAGLEIPDDPINTFSNNGIRIVWNDSVAPYSPLSSGFGSPYGPITLQDDYSYANNGEVLQLQIEAIDPDNPVLPTDQLHWYTNDQQIVQAYWDGRIQSTWINHWFEPRYGHPYPNLTVIYAYVYRQDPNTGNWLPQFIDRVVVYVQ